ncbi:MAG TPA: ferritin family protein [Candidatus Brocadiia bacterium]|nr:ferritin family protein [Candidatus Brocadiia bacterium]
MASLTIAEVVKTGVQMEKEGEKVYRDAAAKTKHPFAKEMFLSLAKDEKRHGEWFLKMGESLGVAKDLLAKGKTPDAFVGQMRDTFGKLRAKIEGLKASADDMKVIEVALGLEEKSYDVYSKAAAAATDPAVKKVLDFVAKEENNHYRILADVKLYLSDPGKWNIKEESPLIDGG